MASPVRAKKHLGQHFLCDENIAKKIVDSIPQNDVPLVEIGPGTGVLTKYLINSRKHFYALDVDIESIDYLHQLFPEKKNQIIFSDFLKADLKQIAGDKFMVIGNFPYNISSQIMFKVLECRNNIPVVVGMFQKEVAQRMAEKPGTKVYGILSVLLQAYFKIEYLFTVHENVFNPHPKVKSAVVRFTRNETEKLSCDETLFFQVVKTAFNQRRKQLKNSLKSLLPENNFENVILNKRPEQLSVSEFVELTHLIEKKSS
ncbi:MAG: 16S rRNA (adenine(1518)-N(6)/adenine(1519)-N(6))-dimethyltransferase RsmA [Sphingobacteriaceae bacterium]|nr:16S rRNA (adenine(1518)-N(6)/adenine(1519)-N(6))-dimethyltransferase RsmA [Sphingobacteriaceae bacterium]